MRIATHREMWQVEDVRSLEAALSWRDARRGGCFWITPNDEEYPALAIRASGDEADIHYFPQEAHPGFRCLGGEGLPAGGMPTFVFQGCDPIAGEETPNKFVIPFETARLVASEFFRTRQMSADVAWFEL